MALPTAEISGFSREQAIEAGKELYVNKLSGIHSLDHLNYWINNGLVIPPEMSLTFQQKPVSGEIYDLERIDRITTLLSTQNSAVDMNQVFADFRNPHIIMSTLESDERTLGLVVGELQEYESERIFSRIKEMVVSPDVASELLPALVRSFEIQVRQKDGVYIVSDVMSETWRDIFKMCLWDELVEPSSITPYKWLRGS